MLLFFAAFVANPNGGMALIPLANNTNVFYWAVHFYVRLSRRKPMLNIVYTPILEEVHYRAAPTLSIRLMVHLGLSIFSIIQKRGG